MSDYLTIAQAAERYGLSPKTLLNALHDGRIVAPDCYQLPQSQRWMWYIRESRINELWPGRLPIVPLGMGYCRRCQQVKPVCEFPVKRLCRRCRNAEAIGYYHRRKAESS